MSFALSACYKSLTIFLQTLHHIHIPDFSSCQQQGDQVGSDNEYWKNEQNDEQTSKWVLGCLTGLKQNVNWKVFANFTKSVSLIRHEKDKLYPDAYEETIEMLIDVLLHYLFA